MVVYLKLSTILIDYKTQKLSMNSFENFRTSLKPQLYEAMHQRSVRFWFKVVWSSRCMNKIERSTVFQGAFVSYLKPIRMVMKLAKGYHMNRRITKQEQLDLKQFINFSKLHDLN